MTIRSRVTVAIGVALFVSAAALLMIFRSNFSKSAKDEPPDPNVARLPNSLPNSIVRDARNAALSAKKWAQSEALLQLPIEFYGRVVDQNGVGVPDATVHISVIDKRDKPGSQYVKSADKLGNFSISGIKGYSFGVSVERANYYTVEGAQRKVGSDASFENNPDDINRYIPDKANPVVFRLHKQGRIEPLTKLREKNFRLTLDGNPVDVWLEKSANDKTRRLLIRLWAPHPQRDERGTFDWKAEISVPDGAILRRKDEFDFMAPVDGYEEKIATDMPGTLPRAQWRDSLEDSFFVRFNDGVYARVDVRLMPDSEPFCVIKGYLNPKVGSQNLEAPPN